MNKYTIADQANKDKVGCKHRTACQFCNNHTREGCSLTPERISE